MEPGFHHLLALFWRDLQAELLDYELQGLFSNPPEIPVLSHKRPKKGVLQLFSPPLSVEGDRFRSHFFACFGHRSHINQCSVHVEDNALNTQSGHNTALLACCLFSYFVCFSFIYFFLLALSM